MRMPSAIEVHVLQAQDRSRPVPFTLRAGDLYGLLSETIQLVKLVATKEKDLEAIRTDHALRSRHLENLHKETMLLIEKKYNERSQMIAGINENSKLLIAAGEYAAAQQIMNRLADFLSNNNPLREALEFRNSQL